MSEKSGGIMAETQQEISENISIIQNEDVLKLLTHFVKHNHRIKSTTDIKGETIMERCKLLFSKDYTFSIVPNTSAELCAHYPTQLIITEFERDPHTEKECVESQYDLNTVGQHMKNARTARCWNRFVIPVIFYQGKHICRSSTLSGAAEMIGRSATDYLLSNQNAPGPQDLGSDMFDKYRGHDISLLKFFDVRYICDLMVEKKKRKFGMPISSSEKVDKENRYSDFDILGMPYPGCEFFRLWKESAYQGDTVAYDWSQSLNNTQLDLPSCDIVKSLHIDWLKYKDWSLTELTQNYIKLLLQYLKDGSGGILIHCISGWDRTPLFVSLLRMSLWADGVIHRSLSAVEMLYLTLGYDWYLFGHDLPDRLGNDEEVLHFCFKTLRDIASEEFCIYSRQLKTSNSVGDESSPPQHHFLQQHSVPQVLTPRVDSDSNFQGVLLSDDVSVKGSTSSLNSTASETAEHNISFILGTHEEEGEEDGLENMAKRYDSNHRRSLSPSQRVSTSRHISPITGHRRRRSSDGQGLPLAANHFVNSARVKSSSPMSVPLREEKASKVMSPATSIGSWQIIPSADNLHALAGSGNSQSSSNDRMSHISSCHEATELNMTSLRWKKLDEVSQLFHSAYYKSIHSHSNQPSSSAGISSLIGKFAEQMGLKRNYET